MSRPLPNDDAGLVAWIDAELDAADATSPGGRWRERVLGGTVAGVMAARPTHRRLCQDVPMEEFVVLRAYAARREMKAVQYVRAAVAAALVGDGAGESGTRWWRKNGVWFPMDATFGPASEP